ncbi:M48 family metalloprotease [Adhaeribacter sp. BT258]|uniref:M48 family metalloprotease n=1 Tax=Adhaeribacter terrigena TaxID=2793070 RepID=A0ABS1C0A4_9BACT|nr:M48 family metalloprotease [Adhaeribacter terrigena]MBK0402838.1 M48 family metalloprotease [Adhaeribacter terrigena]
MKRFFSSNFYVAAFMAAGLMLSSCAKDKNGERLIFSIEDDIALGNQVAAQTDSIYKSQLLEPTDPRPNVQAAYAQINKIVAKILASDQVNYAQEFGYKVKIINDDNTLNAFATPGGHIYVFTGLIKKLDNEDQLAGVLGHEIAHADRRHTSKALERQYGLSVLLSILLGENQNQLVEIGAGLATLKFGRDAETEADFYSVEYLGDTPYTCDGAAAFFEKMQDEQQAGKPPVFLSTHPSDEARITAITDKAKADKCVKPVQQTSISDYQTLKTNLTF